MTQCMRYVFITLLMVSVSVWGKLPSDSPDDIAPKRGYYTVPTGNQGVTVYSQTFTDPNSVDCGKTPIQCLGYVPTRGEIADCNEIKNLCPPPLGGLGAVDLTHYAYVRFSYSMSPQECTANGMSPEWCDRNTTDAEQLLHWNTSELTSGYGYVERSKIVTKPYKDPKGKVLNWEPEVGVGGCCHDDLTAEAAPNPDSVTGKLFKQKEQLKQAAVTQNGCKQYPFTSGCNLNESMEYIPGLKFSTSVSDDQCTVCFFGGEDRCGDPKVSRIRKVEDLAAIMVKRSEMLCRVTERQFESNCGDWKNIGTVEERRKAVYGAVSKLLANFKPTDGKTVHPDFPQGAPALRKHPALTQPVMQCLLNAEDPEYDPNIPTGLMCDEKRYRATLGAARAQLKSMEARHSPDLNEARREFNLFSNANYPAQMKSSDAKLPALKTYFTNYSSASGLVMAVRKTARWLYDDKQILQNYCGEFQGFWDKMQLANQDPYFPSHECKVAANGDELFQMMSDDPSIQLSVGIEIFNWFLNDEDYIAGKRGHKISKNDAFHAALVRWFGFHNPVIPGVMSCVQCLQTKGNNNAECLQHTMNYTRPTARKKRR